MEHDPGQELVKCVLVGDTAVGKTRLICARACNARPKNLRQLFNTHVPTVFAIDQYRMYKEVLQRSMSYVDGVHVSLRLWDTFGDIDKDRRFAYGRSDVILLCFSIGSKSSLQHCKTMWFPEIKKFCPDTPVILVGCKNDLRYLIQDPVYIESCQERSPFFRRIRDFGDLVMGEEARRVAQELGIPYYETSVYTYYGVDQVFENAIRCALLARSQRFWMTNLKHVRQPLLQAPYCPPKKEFSYASIFASTYWTDIQNMFAEQKFADLVFHLGNVELLASRFVVENGAKKLFQFLHVEAGLERRGSESSSVTSESTKEEEWLLRCSSARPSQSAFENSQDETASIRGMIESVKLEVGNSGDSNLRVHVKFRNAALVSVHGLSAYLHFLYMGELTEAAATLSAPEMSIIAESFGSTDFLKYLSFWVEGDKTMMTRCVHFHHANLPKSLWRHCRDKNFTDVRFELDDGSVEAHRAILGSRSDVMKAMLSGNFIERQGIVTLPGVKTDLFWYLLEFIYTDKIESQISIDTSMMLIELANRLCLPRLINIIENLLITEMSRHECSADVLDNCIRIVEPSQLHNAENLAEFCMIFIATNYDDISRNHGKLFKELHPENRQWVLQNRWPPVWYVKDLDYYHKSLKERYKIEVEQKKGRKRNSTGCLCFGGKSRRNTKLLQPPSVPEVKPSRLFASMHSICSAE